MTHTPLPWFVHGDHKTLVASTREGAAMVAVDCPDCGGMPWRRPVAEAAANAAFIVRACNSHDELLAAVRAIAEISENCLHGPTPQVATQTFASPIRNIRRLAFDAIAAAEPPF